MKKQIVAAALIGALTLSAGIGTSQAFNLGSLLGGVVKVGGIGIVVDKFGGQIDSFLNKLLKQNNLSTTYTTKVVPIVSVGGKNYIGAAQVTGPESEVSRVKAVAEITGSFNDLIQVKGLVPVDSVNPVGASRIQGVGVSAIIDVRI